MKIVIDTFQPIRPGYPIDFAFQFPEEFWDAHELASGRLVAQFRSSVPDAEILFQADTADGSISRLEQRTLKFDLSAEATATMVEAGMVVFDLARIAGDQRRAIPGRVSWPVKRTVTRDV